MKRIMQSAARHPLTVLILLAVLTVVSTLQIPGLRVQISAESMLQKDSAAWRRFAAAEEVFGTEEAAVIFLHDPEIHSEANLTVIRGVLHKLRQLPYVSRTASLFNVPNLQNVDGTIHTRPFLKELPQTREAWDLLRAEAASNPLVQDNLISPDGQTIAINVEFRPRGVNPDFDQMVTNQIEALIAPLRSELEEVFQLGMGALRADLTQRIQGDQTKFLPLSVAVLLLALAFTLKRKIAALIPLATAGISVIWTLGFLSAMDIPINIMTSIVPALVIIIGSTEDIHLLAEYSAGIRAGYLRRDAINGMADKMGMAVLLTFLTTYIGFLSIALNDISLLHQFGLAASTGLLFNFIVTVLLVPVLLQYFGHQRTRPERGDAEAETFQRWAVALMLLLRRSRSAVFVGAGIVSVAALCTATQLRVNNSFLDYLDEHSAVRTQSERVHSELSGIHSFSILAASGIQNTFLQVKYLGEIEKIQRKIEQMAVFDRSSSFVDLVALLNRVVDEDTAGPALPDTDDVVRELTLFLDHEDIAPYVSPEFDQARILVRHNITSSDRLQLAVDELRLFIRDNVDPALNVEVTGRSILADQAIDEMVRGQLKSLALVAIVIFGVVSLLFVSYKAGLIALIPNVFSVVMLFGVMGIAGIALNAGTSMIAAIALGICVDDTMHVMTRFHAELKNRTGRKAALIAMLRAESVPLLATSIALAAGFLVFAASSFQPVVHFGLLSAMVILIALFATFLLTPLLLVATELLTVWDLLSCKIKDDTLRKAPLFSGMYIWQIKKLLLASEIRRYPSGSRIIEEGSEGTEMFLVLEGRVEAVKTDADGVSERLRQLSVGELFGEVAPLSGCRRTADVLALEDTRTLVLSWRRIDRLTHLHPILAYRLFRNLTHIIGARLTQTKEYRADNA